jgi:molecular chaperone GrpE (heat shock protein)
MHWYALRAETASRSDGSVNKRTAEFRNESEPCASYAVPLHNAVMLDQIEPKLAKWPFFLGAALLLGAAGFVWYESRQQIGIRPLALVAFCIAAGAAFGVTPFLVQYRAQARLAEAEALDSVVSQIKNIEALAGQISSTTSQWQTVQEQANKTATTAREMQERMAVEAKNFAEFMQRASDHEKATLRLEVEKLRRAERDWLQVLVGMLDHTYALHAGALRSGQSNVIEQVGHFQTACRDVARRVGLTPFAATHAEPFDGQRHQLLDGDTAPPAGATVAETLATGYTFQGRLIRPALVKLQSGNGEKQQGEA